MIADVYVDGERVLLDPTRSLGKGGEADVYEWEGRALKIFKSADHPDYQGLPAEQSAAEARLAIHQRKLREFPTALPPEVITPQSLVTDLSGRRIVGYSMPLVARAEPLLRYGEASFRRAFAPARAVVDVFRELWRVVKGIHASGVVIGDFNDMNVLVTSDHHPRLIDSDSFQFGAFACTVFTERFVDPLLCDPSAKAPRLVKPYGAAADWYAYSALLMQSLLLVGPYGGVHRPRSPGAPRILHARRPLERITVFHHDVQYPKPALSRRVLPDALLHHFHSVFERDERGVFPLRLLDELVFVRCASCGVEHARSRCPCCAVVPPPAVGGRCRRELLFTTRGLIVHACLEQGELRVLHHEDGAYRREDGDVVSEGPVQPNVRARIRGKQTVLGQDGVLVVFQSGVAPRRLSVDTDGRGVAFDANAQHMYWVAEGRLVRDASSAPLGSLWWDGAETIGIVLANQTRLWAGSTFGLGFYRAGSLARAFVFDASRRGINDDLRMPPLPGELVDATCVLDEERAWLFVAAKSAGRIDHLCFVYSRAGKLEASARAERGDGSWLGVLYGKCATRGMLFAATDSGIVRVEVEAGDVRVTRRFDETEPFVDERSALLVGPRGLYVVGPQEIHALRLNDS
ncbi:MAG TPA: hypothetical protein VM925_34020 [Labilithrix sp.]|nr:hypothetical protein [Labilithrix sp.]